MFFSFAWSSWQVWQQITAGFLLAGVKGSWFPPKQTESWGFSLDKEHMWKTGDFKVENGAFHTIIFMNWAIAWESCLCSCCPHCIRCFVACSSHSAYITHPQPTWLPEEPSCVTFGHTDHVYSSHTPLPGIYQANMPWLQPGGQRGLFPMRWERSHSHIQREWVAEGFLLRLCVYNCKCRWSVCQFCDCEVQTAARGFPPSARRLTHQYKHTHNTFSHKGAYPQNPPLMEATAVFSQVFMHSSV